MSKYQTLYLQFSIIIFVILFHSIEPTWSTENNTFVHGSTVLGEYKALIVGINEYEDKSINRLDTAVKDAEELGRVLGSEYGFKNPIVLLDKNATRAGISKALRRLAKESTEKDSILIYYAGHGDLDRDLGGGWWIPSDAKAGVPSTYIDNSEVQRFMRSMKARHVLLISDSCYSGSLFGLKRAMPAQLGSKFHQRLYSDKSRWGLTSGNLEPVADGGKDGHSIFAYHLLKELKTPLNMYFATQELYARIAPIIANNSEQIPMCRPIRDVDDEGGEFIFVRSKKTDDKQASQSAEILLGDDQRIRRAFKYLSLAKIDAAVSEFESLAKAGNPIAAGYMAWINESGVGRYVQNHDEAVLWGHRAFNAGLEQIAHNGDAYGQVVLSNLYMAGLGCKEDKPLAFSWARKSAAQNIPYAQYKISSYYLRGDGVVKDPVEALKWSHKATEQGYALSMHTVGRMYEHGLGTEKDLVKALSWYRKAADKGNMYSEYALGRFYGKGLGVDKDLKQAFKWYKKAADQGFANSEHAVGVHYQQGFGVDKDLKQAFKWYKKAADQGFANSEHAVGVHYQQGLGVDKDLKQALKWYQKAAGQGYAYSEHAVGMSYKQGLGVDKDLAKAIKWFRKAADNGLLQSVYRLGLCYEYGEGVDKDLARAYEFYRKAADKGYPNAEHALGLCYKSGKGVDKDYAKAIEWFRKAADKGHLRAELELGLCYEYGRGVDKDLVKAMEWYRKSADKGYSNAEYSLGLCYEYGKGVDMDLAKATEWYRKAADKGYRNAKKRLNALDAS